MMILSQIRPKFSIIVLLNDNVIRYIVYCHKIDDGLQLSLSLHLLSLCGVNVWSGTSSRNRCCCVDSVHACDIAHEQDVILSARLFMRTLRDISFGLFLGQIDYESSIGSLAQ